MEEVSTRPVFVGVVNRGSKKRVYHAITLENVKPKYPIKMPLKTIFDLNGIDFDGNNLEKAAFDLNINIIFREIIDKKAYQTRNTNGELWGTTKSMKIGFDETSHYWLPLSFKDSTYICSKTQSCLFEVHNRTNNIHRHESTCSDETKVETKQRNYGLRKTPLTDAIDAGFLPEHMIEYRHDWLATYDIESIEIPNPIEQTDLRTIEGYQAPVSIAVYSNLPGTKEKWFYRDDSPESIKKMVHEFVKYLQMLQLQLSDMLPIEIRKAIDMIEESIKLNSGNKIKQQELWRLKNGLDRYRKLNVFGFNSGKLLL